MFAPLCTSPSVLLTVNCMSIECVYIHMFSSAHVFVFQQGEMVIIVTFGGDPISKSPFSVGVAAPLDLSKIEVDGLESSEFSYWHMHAALWCLINY